MSNLSQTSPNRRRNRAKWLAAAFIYFGMIALLVIGSHPTDVQVVSVLGMLIGIFGPILGIGFLIYLVFAVVVGLFHE